MTTKSIGSHNKHKINNRIDNNGLTERRCTICLEWKELNIDNFYMQNKKKPEMGFTPQCRECTKDKSRKYGSEHKEEQAAYIRKWYIENKEITNIKSLQWIADHPEHAKEVQNQWQKSEKGKEYMNTYWHEKTKQHQHKISEKEWKSCLEYFNNECAYCGMTLEDHLKLYKQQLHKEHKNHDGGNDLSNCVPSCRSCNSKKHDKIFDNWYNKSNPNYTLKRYRKIHKWLNEDYKLYLVEKKQKVNNMSEGDQLPI